MSKANIVIHGCIQDIQGMGTPADRVISRIVFDVIVGDRKYVKCRVELSQEVGT